MIKVFSLLRRREDWTREEFQRWWIEDHIHYAKKLPGLRKYKVSLTKGSTTHEGQEPFDGVAELWFDSREALEAAWGSDVGLEAVEHSKANVSSRVVLKAITHSRLGSSCTRASLCASGRRWRRTSSPPT